MSTLEQLLKQVEELVEHFREGLVPGDPESKQHVANSNRAFGADCALDLVRAAVEAERSGFTKGARVFLKDKPYVGHGTVLSFDHIKGYLVKLDAAYLNNYYKADELGKVEA